MTQQCVDCEETLPLARFAMVKRDGGNRVERNKRCRSCQWLKRKAGQGRRHTFFRQAKYRYGLEPDEIDAMILASQGQCDSCGQQFRNIKSEPHIDHCHKTLKVRGLLCTRCNLIAGTLEKETRRVKNVLAYLKRTK